MTRLAAPERDPSSPSRVLRWFQLVLGVVLGTGFLLLLWKSLDVAAVGALLARAVPFPLLIGLAAYVADFALRAVRFWLLLDGRQRAVGPTISPFVASFGISDILPFRLGDAFRVFWFHRHLHLPLGTVLGAMILERMLDLVSIVLLAGLAFYAVDTVSAPIILMFLATKLTVASPIPRPSTSSSASTRRSI